jgi:hypothetical protein
MHYKKRYARPEVEEQMISVSIPSELYSRVRKHCGKVIKIKYFVRDALKDKLDGKKSTKQ